MPVGAGGHWSRGAVACPVAGIADCMGAMGGPVWRTFAAAHGKGDFKARRAFLIQRGAYVAGQSESAL